MSDLHCVQAWNRGVREKHEVDRAIRGDQNRDGQYGPGSSLRAGTVVVNVTFIGLSRRCRLTPLDAREKRPCELLRSRELET